MKRKLLSIVSVVLAMSMTTSAFAATARGTGDVDGDGKYTANDVFKIMQGLAADDAQANVDGRTGVDPFDVKVLYNTILQPKTVSEDLTLKAYSEGMENDVEFGIFNAEQLGSTGRDVQPNGLDKVVTSVDANATTATTIKDAIDQLVDLAANQRTAGIVNQINNIYFNGAVKGDVYLTSENGWAKLCNALRFIVPMDKATAALCNSDNYADYNYYDPATATAEETSRYNALMDVKEFVVGSREVKEGITDDEAQAQHPIVLDSDGNGEVSAEETNEMAAKIVAAKNALYTAIPAGLDENVIRLTAAEVLSITGTRYHFTVNSEDMGIDEVLDKETDVNSSAFINGLVELSDYANKTMADYRNTFGDKLTVGTPNVKVTFEVAVIAGIDEGSSEATTNTPSEPTTESSTEAPTESSTEAPTESSTEAPTESTTETPVSGELVEVVNANDLTKGTISTSTAFGKFTVTADSSNTVSVDANNKSIDDYVFTQRLKLSGAGAADYRSVKFNAASAGNIIMYAMSSNGTDARTVSLYNEAGEAVQTVTVPGDAIAKYTFAVPGAGTYYIASESGGLNIYLIGSDMALN